MNSSNTIHTSGKVRHIRITVLCNGRVEVVAPRGTSEQRIHAFMLRQEPWIARQREHFRLSPCASALLEKPDYARHKELACSLVRERLHYFNVFYGYAWKNIHVKNTRTIWGSCSKNGNLNFNYKIALLPKNVADYVIVHELCHLQEFNHSGRFWELISRTIPDPHTIRAMLKSCDLLL